MAIRFVTYTLQSIRGPRPTVGRTLAEIGVVFTGGLWPMGDRAFAMLEGRPDQVQAALLRMQPFQVRPLNLAEAFDWIERACPTNSRGCDGGYIGPPEVDPQTGRIIRAWSREPFDATAAPPPPQRSIA
ncbi:MAG: hypothetical protein GYB68_16430 [Chloroflexi bacterium]|nr:hypothetical protein [Chloroflexota bacterium]